MNVRSISWMALALMSISAQFTLGCSGPDMGYDCVTICNANTTCMNESANRFDCAISCEDKGATNPEFALQASECESCLENQSCAAAAVECGPSCSVVITESPDT